MKSAKTIAREKILLIAKKEFRFRPIAQYAEGVSRVMPELLGNLVVNKLQQKAISYHEAKKLVAATY